ncbi:MAG: 2-hydroxyacyl-CoA dehydratase [bacterium]
MIPAKQINYRQWHELFKEIPDERVKNTRYYHHLPDAEWSQYLFPPSTHAVYGNRLLRKLKFDNSPAALRLWGFVLSESERIYRARQAGMKVVAVVGDLGAITPLVYSFPDTVAFYPDCLWWTPFLMESRVLFNEAGQLGMGEDCCFVRAALGAFSKRAYFPKPNLIIGTVGATCDDMAAVMSGTEFIGNDVYYLELPARDTIPGNQQRQLSFLADRYREVATRLEAVTGHSFSEDRLHETVGKVNLIRSLISEVKDLAATTGPNPMGGMEMMNVEFAALSYYGDLEECTAVLGAFRDEMKARVEQQNGYPDQPLRIVWVTPPADPILQNYAEDLGARIVGSEYVINQSTPALKTEGDVFENLAEGQLAGSLMGSSRFRVDLVVDQVRRAKADGVIISGIFASTHCPYETRPIIDAVRKEGVPVLAFDVVAPGKKQLQSQIYNRMEAFIESLRMRRSRRAG